MSSGLSLLTQLLTFMNTARLPYQHVIYYDQRKSRAYLVVIYRSAMLKFATMYVMYVRFFPMR